MTSIAAANAAVDAMLDILNEGKFLVLQVNSGGDWQDYATLRDGQDVEDAVDACDFGQGCIEAKDFRIITDAKRDVLYPKV